MVGIYSVGLVLVNSELLNGLNAFRSWGKTAGFEIVAVFQNMSSLQTLLPAQTFDLLFAEAAILTERDYALLRDLKKEGRCKHIVLCGADRDFEAARRGIIYGLDDYFTLPFEKSMFYALFDRIGVRAEDLRVSVEEQVGRLAAMFSRRDDGVYALIDELYFCGVLPAAVKETVRIVFEENDWLDLYINEKDCSSAEAAECKYGFTALFEAYKGLCPRHNESLDALIEYILFNPENDLRQKVISKELRINKSYLSTVFFSQTNIRYVDYVTYVKLMRSAWLLKNTDLKINEIAARMDYKDVAYFSKQFKKTFSITPSAYRLPDNYRFDI